MESLIKSKHRPMKVQGAGVAHSFSAAPAATLAKGGKGLTARESTVPPNQEMYKTAQLNDLGSS